jgi:DNA-binding response OmpR family regulator
MISSAIRPLLLEALRSAAGEPIPVVDLALRIYGSADADDVHALMVAIYHLRRCRPDLKIETIGYSHGGRQLPSAGYRLAVRDA